MMRLFWFFSFVITFPLIAAPHSKDPVSVYIQQSKTGLLEKQEDATYTLILKGNSLNLVYFTDQPHRTTGQKNLTQHFQAWKKNEKLKREPPTAFINFNAFKATRASGVTPDILMLQDPHYDEENDTLIFKVRPLHDRPIQMGSLEQVVIIYDSDE